MTNRPNLFIIGAPKAGTTAFADYLKTHPEIFISTIKEPFYFCSDMPILAQRENIYTQQDYLKLFNINKARNKKYYCDASTLYLYSETAVKQIYKFNQNAKIIVFIRNPIEIAYSFHNQMLFHFVEDEYNFECAWKKQEQRLKGDNIPVSCPEAKLLHYMNLCSLGSQLERLYNIFPTKQIYTIDFNDIKKSPLRVYQNILNFLDLYDDGRQEFPIVNQAMVNRYPLLSKILRTKMIKVTKKQLKNAIPEKTLNLIKRRQAAFLRKPRKLVKISDSFHKELHNELKQEIDLIKKITSIKV